MWNWKLAFEDDTCVFYCDLDKIVDTVSDEAGLYASIDCYQPIPDRFGVWTSLSFKKKTSIKLYLQKRKETGLHIDGYENYQYSLCLVEFNTQTMKYRIIPATDYDKEDRQIGDSYILEIQGESIIVSLSDTWTDIISEQVHPMIRALYALFSSH